MSKNKLPWYYSGLAFSCRQCGRCCAGPEEGYIWVSEPERVEIAGYLNISEAQAKEKYMRRVGPKYTILEDSRTKDCIFLRRDREGRSLCEIYPARPVQCRTWPFWTDNLKSPEDWQIISERCPGLDQDQWYTYNRIEAIRAGDSEMHTPDMPLEQAVWEWLLRDRGKANALKAVGELYKIVDQHLADAQSDCRACGQCCHFEKYGHRLFFTTLEMLYLLDGIEKLGLVVPATAGSGCPFQQGSQCLAREYRPTGCRIFFCQGLNQEYQNELSEESLRQLRQFHQHFNAVYYYADMPTWLAGYRKYAVG